MRLKLLALASAFAGMSLLVTGIASADIVTEATLTFTATSGGPTPTGSWIFDDTRQVFTSWTVSWDGIDFSFTSLARNPSVPVATQGTWCGAAPAAQAPLPSCQYFYPGDFLMDDIAGGPLSTTFTDYSAKGQGTYTLATERTFNTPEPSTLTLFGTALVGLGYALRRRRRDGLCSH